MFVPGRGLAPELFRSSRDRTQPGRHPLEKNLLLIVNSCCFDAGILISSTAITQASKNNVCSDWQFDWPQAVPCGGSSGSRSFSIPQLRFADAAPARGPA
jgi:hypothetical protein